MPSETDYPQTGLKLPKTLARPADIFTDDQSLNHWLQQLPVADAKESAQILVKSLSDANSSDLNSIKRLKILETVQPLIEDIVPVLSKRYLPSKFPLTTKEYEQAQLTCKLYLEMATGYKQAFAQQIIEDKVSQQKSAHVIALHRCMFYLQKTLFLSAIIYDDYPPTLWHETHQLFSYSSINKLDRIPIENSVTGQKPSTVKQLYKQSLLFAVVSPFQMAQSEIIKLIKLLPELDNQVTLVVMRADDKPIEFGFFMNLNSDDMPLHIAQIPDGFKSSVLTLQTGRLLQRLLAAGSSEDVPLQQVNRHLRSVLLKNLGYKPHRNLQRDTYKAKLDLVSGLHKVHSYIDGHDSDNNLAQALTDKPVIIRTDHHATDNKAEFDLQDVEVLTKGASGLHNEHHQENLVIDILLNKDKPIDASDLFHPAEEKYLSNVMQNMATSINKSDNGYCLDWSNKNLPAISIGDVVCIKPEEGQQNFTLAVTRWMKNTGRNFLVGIEVLSKDCHAILFKAKKVSAKHHPKTEYQGLLLARQENKPAELIIEQDQFNNNDTIILTSDSHQKILLKLNHQIESTGLLDRFEIEYLQ